MATMFSAAEGAGDAAAPYRVGKLLFSDDFTDGLAGWTAELENGGVEARGGEMTAGSASAPSPATPASATSASTASNPGASEGRAPGAWRGKGEMEKRWIESCGCGKGVNSLIPCFPACTFPLQPVSRRSRLGCPGRLHGEAGWKLHRGGRSVYHLAGSPDSLTTRRVAHVDH